MELENEMQSDLGKLTDDWNGIDTIGLYGIGLVADRFIDKLVKDFHIPYIIDRKKAGKEYKSIPIIKLEEALKKIEQCKVKIVVLTSQRVYEEIKRSLENTGLIEFEDFCRVEQFVAEWYLKNKNQLNVIQLNTAVTTWCTLNCEKCNMFMPYYKAVDRKHYKFEEMKEDIDTVLKFVDYIFSYSFLGGEPFLNSDLSRIITYVGENYSDRVGKLGVTTNGTIIPDQNTLEQLKKYNVSVSISDYTKNVPYEEKIEKLVCVLDQWEISYIRNEMTEWKDFGFPEKPFHWGKNKVKEHMQCCAPLFHGINDKKIYYCHIIWSAEKAGLYTVPEEDYIDLDKLNADDISDRMKVVCYCTKGCERGFLGLCMLCGGCGEDNNEIIDAGIQKEYDIGE